MLLSNVLDTKGEGVSALCSLAAKSENFGPGGSTC